jgi:hypothetical protein
MAWVEDLDAFMGDFGVACSKGGTAFTGVLDTPDETLNLGGVNMLSTMYALQVKTVTATALSIATGDTLTVGGGTYIVRDVMLEDDGAFSKLTLSK